MTETLTKSWDKTPGEQLRDRLVLAGSEANALANAGQHKWASGHLALYRRWETKPIPDDYRQYAQRISEAWQHGNESDGA